MNRPLIYLASASPRRSQLLNQIGVLHRIRPVDIDESRLVGEPPADYVRRLATAKAKILWERLSLSERLPALGADTTVALGDEIFGKPGDQTEGTDMLMRLAGRVHQVFTAVALFSEHGCEVRLSLSEVTFGKLTVAECADYWESGEPHDKAGGYAVQGGAAAFITHIAGSYSGIMGLPLAETASMLKTIGWSFVKTESSE
ncbi:MAG: septum formation inhibitor Maf [Candidatus Obscuribacterales bacterium]|nr:septum formation inhibitor Maf [Steroidobacteraceae bacterium]